MNSIPGIEKNIGALAEKAADRYRGKEAIHFDHEGIGFSFEELNAKGNQFSNALYSKGVRKGDHVAVMLPNCPEFVLIWLGLAKLGAIIVPVNFRYQTDDLKYVLNDSNATVLAIHCDVVALFREIQAYCPKVRIIFQIGKGNEAIGDLIAETAIREPKEFELADLGPDDIASIQYTSGTTGFPKGCMLTHEYWLSVGRMTYEKVTEQDIFLSVQAFYYMDPQWQIIMTMIYGCTMILAKKYSPSRYMELVRKYGVTFSLPVRAILIFKQNETSLDGKHKLQFVNIFGFPPGLHKAFEKRFNVVAREAYGMTEIGSCMRVPISDSHMTGSGSVGKPVPYRKVKIVNEEGKEVVQGEIGELLVKGPGLFKGYYDKPKETDDAFSKEWFHTGDLFYQDAKGYYYIVGRKKDTVRRLSENISAKEVEDVIKSHPRVFDAAVIPVPDEIVGEEVKAYVIPRNKENEKSIDPKELIAFCSERIAKFKVPRFIEYREAFPRTPTERVEKHRLISEKKDLRSGSYDAEVGKVL